MTQATINQYEWDDPKNWSDSVIGIYSSKRDTRLWVPKRGVGFGWTLNLGHPRAAWWLVGIIVAPIVLAAVLRRRSVRDRCDGPPS
jgi:uncharacterized membrane protein